MTSTKRREGYVGLRSVESEKADLVPATLKEVRIIRCIALLVDSYLGLVSRSILHYVR